MCQSAYSVTSALIGRPSAPPTPSVALIRAIAESTRFVVQHVAQDRDAERHDADDGALQRAADEHADEARRERGDDRARARAARAARSTMRRLPYMSPRRPAIGVKIAAASRVDGHDPRGVFAARVEQFGQLRLDRHDEREHERRGETGEGQHRDDGALPRHPGESSSRVLIPDPIAPGYRRAATGEGRAAARWRRS